jgi:pyridoxine 5'-phosphate synthase PdxJ
MQSFLNIIKEERLSGIILSIGKDIQIIRSLIVKQLHLNLNDEYINDLLNDVKELESQFIDLKNDRHKDSTSCHLIDFYDIHDKLTDIMFELERIDVCNG